MSFAHVRLSKIFEDAAVVRYLVASPDFEGSGRWQEVAEVVIEKQSRTYSFSVKGLWEHEKVVPPYVYGLTEDAMAKELAGKYGGHGYGAWTGRIYSHIRTLISSKNFPEQLGS